MKLKLLLSIGILIGVNLAYAGPESTAFTYLGWLDEAGNPANGAYDFQFGLYDAATNGNLVAGFETNSAVAVVNGFFTTTLDFGNVFNGTAYWLNLGVRSNGSGGAFVSLQPRQPILAAPMALYSFTAGTASNANSIAATNIIGVIPTGNLSSSVALLNGSNLFTGTNTFAGPVALSNAGNIFSGVFAGSVTATSLSGNGSGLTNLPPNSIAALNQLTVYSNLAIANPNGILNFYDTTNSGATSNRVAFITQRRTNDGYIDSHSPPTAGVLGVTGPYSTNQLALTFYDYGADIYFNSAGGILEFDGMSQAGTPRSALDLILATGANILQLRNNNDTGGIELNGNAGSGVTSLTTEIDNHESNLDLAIWPEGNAIIGAPRGSAVELRVSGGATQTLNIYATYSSSNNYDRMSLGFDSVSNMFNISTGEIHDSTPYGLELGAGYSVNYNKPGANTVIYGGQGTGTGMGGSIIFQTAPPTSSGNTPNAKVNALVISNGNLYANGLINGAGMVRATNGFASYATNHPSMTSTGFTNGLAANNVEFFGFTGTSVTYSNSIDNYNVSLGSISTGQTIILAPGCSVTGTSCAASGSQGL